MPEGSRKNGVYERLKNRRGFVSKEELAKIEGRIRREQKMPRGVRTVMLAPSKCIRFDDPRTYKTLKFPMYASPKLDGVRMVINHTGPLSRSFKVLPNRNLRLRFMEVMTYCLHKQVVFDGEIWAPGHEFAEISGSVRRIHDPLPDWIEYHVFDYMTRDHWEKGTGPGFAERVSAARERIRRFPGVRLIPQKLVRSLSEARDQYELFLSQGHEGMMLKSPFCRYKHGRATVKEATFFKVKAWEEAIGRVIGFKRRREMNEGFLAQERSIDEMGRTKRTHKQEHYQYTDEFGSVEIRVLTGPYRGRDVFVTFAANCWPQDCSWDQRHQFLQQVVTFEYLPVGSKNLPRHGRITVPLVEQRGTGV